MYWADCIDAGDQVGLVPTSRVNRPTNWGEITEELGRRVRERRESLKLTQEDLQERSGVSRNQIQNIENARGNSTATSNPKLDMIWALATALEIEVSDLVKLE